MRQEIKEFFQTGSIYSVGTVAERAVRLLYLPIVTAYLSPSAYGVAALAIVTAQLFEKLMAPYSSALNRYYYNPEFIPKRSTLVASLFALVLTKTFLVSIAYVLVAPSLAQTLGGGQDYAGTTFQLFTLVILLQPTMSFQKAILRLQQQAFLFVSISLFQVITSLGIIIVLLAIFDFGITAIPIASAGGLLVAVMGMLPSLLRTIDFRFDLRLCQEPLRYGYPLIFSAYSNYALQSADRFILRIFFPLALVGIYDVAYKVAGSINFLLAMPAKQALHPIAFKKEDDPENQRRFIRRTATVYYSFALCAGLGLSLFAKGFLMVFARDPSYWQGWVLIPLIVFGFIQHGLGHFVGLGMVMRKKAFLQSGTLIATAGINIILNFLLIPSMGLIGAAVATVAAYIVWNVQKSYFSWKYYGLEFEYRRLMFLTVLWCLLLAPGIFVFHDLAPLPIIGKLILFGLFPVILLYSGFLKPDEKDFIHVLFRSIGSKICGYIRSY